MKKATDSLKQYQKKDLQKKLKEEFLTAKKNKMFAKLVNQINQPTEVLYKFTSLIEECSQEHENCQTCESLFVCQNKVIGYAFTPIVIDEKLEFIYQPCRYQKKMQQETAYLNNVVYFQMPKELVSAQMKEIYADDENRFATIAWLNKFINDYPKVEKGLYLHGSFGCGKSYLVIAMLNELAKKKVKSVVIYWPEFLRYLKGSFDSDFNERFSEVKEASLLLIDDIGAENMTEWGRDEILASILQYRMTAKLPTFFTSNFSLSELETHLAKTKEKVSVLKARRIIERINNLAEEQKIVAKNYRN